MSSTELCDEGVADTRVVSEAIGLEIVAFNGGSYTGAIFFTGWMYIGAAVCLWLVRTWKIGEMEAKAAVAGEHGGSRNAFVQRMFMWQKV